MGFLGIFGEIQSDLVLTCLFENKLSTKIYEPSLGRSKLIAEGPVGSKRFDARPIRLAALAVNEASADSDARPIRSVALVKRGLGRLNLDFC